MKLTKIVIGSLYTLIVVCIGIATVIEKYRGSDFVGNSIYGAWWFSALWGVLTVVALVYLIRQRLYRRVAVLLLHLSFVVILAGALTTHLFAERGTVCLRMGVPEMTYVDADRRVHHLPFLLTLKDFRIINYPGTDAPLDYQSVIELTPYPAPKERGDYSSAIGDETVISMNHIGNIDGYRFFQKSYDSDRRGVILGLNHDPYGIAISYVGYLLLLLGIIATLLSRHTQMRTLYRKAVAAALLLVSFSATATGTPAPDAVPAGVSSLPTVPADIAHRLGTIPALYNNRICPLNTVATDFTLKLTGSASWHGYSADEVFFSWMIYYDPWEKAILSPSPYALPAGEGSGPNQGQEQLSEKQAIVEMFYSGQFLKIFPYSLTHDTIPEQLGRGGGGEAVWFSPGGQVLPREIPVKEQFFIKQSMDFLTESIVTGQHDRAIEIIEKIKLFQRDMVGDVLPSNTKIHAEIFFNTLRAQKWPVFLALTLSLLLCVMTLVGTARQTVASRGGSDNPHSQNHSSLLGGSRWHLLTLLLLAILLLAYVTLQLALRWWLSGHIPVSNGPETMLFMAWAMLLLTIQLQKKFPIILGFGPLIASFCLLVALLGGKGAEITPLMPVLQSPLLSIHVMTVMCAYALFALQLLLGIYALANATRYTLNATLERTTALSQLLLYPAVFLLAVGIFLGAVWANVSWGNYWSWDPKESWALITLMVYAVPFHHASFGRFRKPLFYHCYMVCAFLVVLITYFGVNYLLGGMHSYA